MENLTLAKHVYNSDYSVVWEDTKMFCREGKCSQWKWKMHDLHIEQTNNAVVNEDNGSVLPDVYKPLLNNRRLANFRYK